MLTTSWRLKLFPVLLWDELSPEPVTTVAYQFALTLRLNANLCCAANVSHLHVLAIQI